MKWIQIIVWLVSAMCSAHEEAPFSLDTPTTLFFTSTAYTSGADAVPQLSCTGGSGAPYYRLHNLSCSSLAPITSFSQDELHWKCSTTLPDEFLLGQTTVSCQPYADSMRTKDGTDGVNHLIVEGSCAVQYTIQLSELGEQREAELKVLYDQPEEVHDVTGKTSEAQGLLKYTFWTLFVGTATFIAYSIFQGFSNPVNANRLPHAGRGNGGNGGGNGGFPGSGGGGGGDTSDWSPINAHSIHAVSANNRMQTRHLAGSSSSSSSSGIQTTSAARSGTTRTDSSVAPPIVRENQGYESSRPVSSFGGTVPR